MSDLSSSENSGSDSLRAVHCVSFAILQEVGPAALALAPDLGIEAVFLVEAVHRWFNAYNLKTTLRADDLFAAADRIPDISELFPKGAELLTLTLEIIFENCPEPCRVVLEPPNRLLVLNGGFADRIETFLTRRGLVQIVPEPASAPSGTGCQTTKS